MCSPTAQADHCGALPAIAESAHRAYTDGAITALARNQEHESSTSEIKN